MESLMTNKPLLYSLLVSSSAVLALASGLLPDVMTQFQLVQFDTDVRVTCLFQCFDSTVSCLLHWTNNNCLHCLSSTPSVVDRQEGHPACKKAE